jgi:hypothetical protein
VNRSKREHRAFYQRVWVRIVESLVHDLDDVRTFGAVTNLSDLG